MCGICGIVDFSGRPIPAAEVELMRDAMVRRGPDDAGLKLLSHVGLGHRRLSIIDLSESGHQPMCNEDENLWVVFNGEIYDYQELRRDLLKAGHPFRSDSDTEVLLHGYEEWGLEGLLKRINGMFAFALWDVKRDELYLVRDRLGKKPLFYGEWQGRFFFSSEIKSLWLAAHKALKFSLESVASFLYWGYIPGPDTIFKEVRQLPPRSWLRFSKNGIEIRQYWHLTFAQKKDLQWSDALAAVDEELRQAVRRRLYSDVPVGAFLSGGVDSSLVTSYMSKLSNAPVRTFSISFDHAAHNEQVYAQRVAAHCQTQHLDKVVHADAQAILPALVWEFGQPFGDAAAIPTYYVAKAAREHVTVALTGDGGDESFAGYSQHQGRLLGHILSRLIPGGIINTLVEHSRSSYEKGEEDSFSSFQRLLRYASTEKIVSLSGVNFWGWSQLQSLWPSGVGKEFSRETLLKTAQAELQKYDGENPLDEALYLDFCMLLPFDYNVKVDVATMYSSLEARAPFLDYKVVELAAGLKPGDKLRYWEKKYLLKRLAARYLPREIIFRPKHGFSMPIDEWMAEEWSEVVYQVVFGPAARARGLFDFDYLERCWQDHRARVARHGYRFWLLLWLELWFQMFVDGARTCDAPLVH